MSRVFVLGNAGIDLAMPVSHLPRPGETVVASSGRRAPGGKGLNQAVAAARAGAMTSLLAAVGDDADGRFVAAQLAGEDRLDIRLIAVEQATDLSVVLVDAAGENSIVTAGACADALPGADAVAFVEAAGAGDVLLLQGNLSLAVTLMAARRAQARGATVVFNTAPLRWAVNAVLAHCDVVVANRIEALEITGSGDPAAAAAMLRSSGPSRAIVTLGGDGCCFADPSGVRYAAAVPAGVVDSTGAGDTFCGVLAAGFARGWPAERGIEAAQLAAAITVTRAGAYAALPRAAELGWLNTGHRG